MNKYQNKDYNMISHKVFYLCLLSWIETGLISVNVNTHSYQKDGNVIFKIKICDVSENKRLLYGFSFIELHVYNASHSDSHMSWKRNL